MDARHWIDKIMIKVDAGNDWVWLYVIIMLFGAFMIMYSPAGQAKGPEPTAQTKPFVFDVMKLTPQQIQEIFDSLEKRKPSGKTPRKILV